MTSPNYIDYFYGLANEEKAKLLKTQKSLYKGISNALIDKIYRRLYEYSILRPSSVKLQCNLELKSIKKIPDPKRGYELNFKQVEQGRDLSLTSDAVVFGAGYEYYEPEFSICRQVFMMWIDFIPLMAVVMKFLFKMLKSIVMGVIAADLGMGSYRNACILNQICGRAVYPVEIKTTFQDFGVEKYFTSIKQRQIRK